MNDRICDMVHVHHIFNEQLSVWLEGPRGMPLCHVGHRIAYRDPKI